MGNQIFLGLWGRDFIGSKFILNINFNKYYTNAWIYIFGDVNSWTRAIHKSHEHWSPNNNDDSTL